MRGQIFRDTDYYACRLLGIRVRVTLEHAVNLPDEGEEACVSLSTRIVNCSGSVDCGWLHGEHRARSGCPYRVALGDEEQMH